MSTKRIHCQIKRTKDGTIAIVTAVTGRDFAIARDTTGRGHVVVEKLPKGTRVRYANGEWRMMTE